MYRLLRAVTWRYVGSPYSGSVPLSCFYGGLILDEFRYLLRLACTSPGDVSFESSYVGRIDDLCTRFMDHFEEITEPKLNTDYSVSGSKIIDLLNCIMDDEGVAGACQQEVTINKTECNIRARYRLQRSWLMCLSKSKTEDEGAWSTEQGLMYRWLRRLITINNEFVMDQTHYELELLHQDTAEPVPKRPVPAVYSGCEELSGQLFWYGSMNESAFDKLWAQQSEIDHQIPTDSNLNDSVFSDADPQLLPQIIEPPPLDLHIDIEIKCPIELAPIEYLENSPLNNFESLWNRIVEPIDSAQSQGRRSAFFFKMVMLGPDLFQSILPSPVQFEIKSSDFGNANTIYLFRNKDYCADSV